MARSALEVCLLLGRADAALRRRFDASLSAHGLSRDDLAILRDLANAPSGALRRVDLAERFGIQTSTLTRVLHPLERTGLVAREEDAPDARTACVLLTRAGRSVVHEAEVTAAELAEDLLAHLDADVVEALRAVLLGLTPGWAPVYRDGPSV